ncbi:MAG: hypothetical protein N2Z80_02865 [Hydrogenothermaceae bacterium]|nr:hypothetical protein [Hydrogenothermaceae bacterium]
MVQLSQYTLEGLFYLLDHSNLRVVAFNLDFNLSFNTSLSNRALKSLSKNLAEYFEFRTVQREDRKSFRSIVYTDVEEFFKRIIRKELQPMNTPEGVEQRLYNIPKTGIKLNRNLLSKNRDILQRQIKAIILSYTAYSYYTNNYEILEEEDSFYIIPKYKYIPLKERVSPENSLLK